MGTDNLRITRMRFPTAALEAWKSGNYEVLTESGASGYLKRVLVNKARKRHLQKPVGYFFGEAFVAAHVHHDKGYYGSFKWLTSDSYMRSHEDAKEYGEALNECFPSRSVLRVAALAMRPALLEVDPRAKSGPVPPDLWLINEGRHRFIEVKIFGYIRVSQMV